MATLNLGRIKPVFRGAYSGSTAYVVDDIVTSGGSSYICIQAHGAGTQAVNQTAYWTQMAAGGTDVGTTITTQGDILFRDGSGLQRLAKGTASQVLKMNSGATAHEWGTDEGGKVLQVVTDTKGDVMSHGNDTPTDVTGLSVSITPTATTSKMLVMVSLGSFNSDGGNDRAHMRLKQTISGGGDSFPFNGDAGTGYEVWATNCFRSNDGQWHQHPMTCIGLTGAVGTTSAITYTPQIHTDGSGTVYLNRSNGQDSSSGNCFSTITVMEIAG